MLRISKTQKGELSRAKFKQHWLRPKSGFGKYLHHGLKPIQVSRTRIKRCSQSYQAFPWMAINY